MEETANAELPPADAPPAAAEGAAAPAEAPEQAPPADQPAEAAEGGDNEDVSGQRMSRKRKVALMFGYVGKGYAGMQRNPGVWTIEDELEKGLAKAGVIAPEDVGDFQQVRRSTRGDFSFLPL